MEQIRQALSPEALAAFRRTEKLDARVARERLAEIADHPERLVQGRELDRRLDAIAKQPEGNRHERRAADAKARRILARGFVSAP